MVLICFKNIIIFCMGRIIYVNFDDFDVFDVIDNRGNLVLCLFKII